jgi:hypothetical protein
VSNAAADGARMANLKHAAETLDAVSRAARSTSSALATQGSGLSPVAGGITALIGGTASGFDKRMADTVLSAHISLADARAALDHAAQLAAGAAAEAMAAARKAQRGR